MCTPQVTRHTSIRYSSSCHTHVSKWMHRYSSLLQWSVPLGQRGRMAIVGRIPLRTLYEMHVAQQPQTYSCDIPTHKTISPPERTFSHYIHSHRVATEMWTTMKKRSGREEALSFSLYLYRFRKWGSYGFPIIHFCNPGIHYETPCIIVVDSVNKRNIYATFLSLRRFGPMRAVSSSFLRFLDHQNRRITGGRTLWMSDRLFVQTSTWQPQHSKEINIYSARKDSNPQSHETSGLWDRQM